MLLSTLDRWVIRHYIATVMQVICTVVGVAFFSRMISQLTYLNADYNISDAFFYVLNVLPAEICPFWAQLFTIGITLFVLKLYFKGQLHAISSLGYQSGRLFRLVMLPTFMVGIIISYLGMGAVMENYQAAKLDRTARLTGHNFLTIWQANPDEFTKLKYDIKHGILYAPQRMSSGNEAPQWAFNEEERFFFQQNRWVSESGKIANFHAPSEIIRQIFEDKWLSLSQLMHLQDVKHDLALERLLFQRIYAPLSAFLQLAVALWLILVCTRSSLRDTNWFQGILVIAGAFFTQWMIGSLDALAASLVASTIMLCAGFVLRRRV